MTSGYPDWLRAFLLLGKHDTTYLPVLLDPSGNLYAVIKGDKGAGVLANVAVDADGQLIMVPRGASGNYLAVDADGYLGAILKAAAEVTVPGGVDVTQTSTLRQVQGKDGVTYRDLAVDASGQIIMVPRGQSGVYLAVDADGNLTTVIKGEYEGALRTVKLDDQGRLSAFVVDELDAWGQMLQVGNAEQAIRMGSIVRLDRRGTVVFMDGFEDGTSRWYISTGGTGTAHTITPERAFSGGYSLRFTSPSGAGDFIQTYTQLPTCLATSFGISAMLRAPDEFTDVYLKLDVYTGITLYRVHARLHYATLKVQVYNSASAWQDVCAFLADEGSTAAFHMLKVCGDISTGKFIRLLYDNNEYNLSAIAMSAVGTAVISKLIGIVMVYGEVGANSVVEIDDVIVTTNES